MDESFNQCWMQFFTLYKFHTTTALRVIDKTRFGQPVLTFPDGGYPVTLQLPKIGYAWFLQSPLAAGFNPLQPQRNGGCQSLIRNCFRPVYHPYVFHQIDIHFTVIKVSSMDPIGALVRVALKTTLELRLIHVMADVQ